ncbi:penicillin acylase family protein [Fluviispira multicolorata]|uniref:Penicillin acylase family protein n=1 Tax=Fluviispira multicolorata TaxID=2654512 RepID=A0A833JAP5_9BACT|nr:penicillin acylase family protein [Fluviispira multicolorata]KAB8028086.1 penicillin acylase family protein [Fluviispira multicolorata]
MKKLIKYLGLFILISVSSLLIFIYFIYSSTQNLLSGNLKINGLLEKVIVNRDQYGVPHIEAENDSDAYFTLGFLHAQDRMWQMEIQRHLVKGSLSEMFGEATLSKDKALRTLGFYRAAQSAYLSLPKESKDIVESYTKGVNYFIKNGKMPIQLKLIGYTPSLWTNIDSIAFQKMMAWDLNETWRHKILNHTIASLYGPEKLEMFAPKYPDNAPLILNDNDLNLSTRINANIIEKTNYSNEFLEQSKSSSKEFNKNPPPGKGSNNWVVSGKLTNTNKPILANDPHLSLASPLLWYLADIKSKNFHSIGATLPGLPGVIIGHNEYLAWGVTNGCIDAQDLYVESEDQVLTTINEVIKVKNGQDVIFPVKISSHGPIISEITEASRVGKKVALKWTGLLENDTTLHAFIMLNYAKNWDDFKNALSYFIVPSQNYVYADKKGNIGYYLAGKIPIRDKWSGLYPIDSKKDFEWNKFIPFHEMPNKLNPEAGFIVSANNKVVSNNYPYSLTPRCETAPYRASRIIDLLHNNEKLTLLDFKKIQNDTVSYLWNDFKSILLNTTPTDSKALEALEKLKKWNGDMNINSHEATLFAYWFRELGKIVPDNLKVFSQWPEPLFIKNQLETNGKFCQNNEAKNCSEFLSNSLNKTMKAISQDKGTHQKNWNWGYTHKAIFNEIGLSENKYLSWFWNRSISSPGDGFTVNVGSYEFNNFSQIAGAGYRQIVDFNNLEESVYIQALGQSGNIFSKNYDDLMPLWRDGKYIPMSSEKERWGKYETLILEPS